MYFRGNGLMLDLVGCYKLLGLEKPVLVLYVFLGEFVLNILYTAQLNDFLF